MKTHCHASAYAFQIEKCLSDTCFYCKENPVRLLIDEFKKLHFLPLPLLDTTSLFEEVYGRPPSDIDQPTKVHGPCEDKKQIDKNRKSFLVAAKVRGTISCGECGKHVVFRRSHGYQKIKH